MDRIDFVTTEHHPRDFNNSIFHGYVQAGKLHRSDGTVIDENVLDNEGQPTTKLTKVFAAGSVFGPDTFTHAWTVCLRRDREGGLFALITTRANDDPENSNFSDHRLLYARFHGLTWWVSEAARLGARLWPAEQDYTGLGDIDPAEPEYCFHLDANRSTGWTDLESARNLQGYDQRSRQELDMVDGDVELAGGQPPTGRVFSGPRTSSGPLVSWHDEPFAALQMCDCWCH